MPPSLLCGWTLEKGSVAFASLDPVELIRVLEDPSRDEVARPDEVIDALRLTSGQVIGDIGAGTGYFARRFARRVGPEGRVFAVDIEPRVLEELTRRAVNEGIKNIIPILASPGNSTLDEASCDLLFLRHVYVHIPDRVDYLRHLRACLKPGGRIVIIGWRRGISGPRQGKPLRRALTRDHVAEELDAAGFSVVEDVRILPEEYFLIASPRE